MSIRFQPAVLAAAAVLAFSMPAQAHIQDYFGSFVTEGGNGRTGSGSLYMEYEEETNTLSISVTFAGLSGNTTVSHIHCCTAAANTGNAGVALAGGAGGSLINFPVGVKGATYNQSFNLGLSSVYSLGFVNANGGTATGARDALLSAFDSGKAYFNIHSSTFGGGEIRALISPVPEPASYALMLAGGMGLAAFARRRKQPD